MIRKLLFLSAVANLIFLGGCASITQGTSQAVTFKLEPPETKCVLTRTGDGEIGSVSSSSNTVTIHKDKDDIVIQCAAPGYQPKTARLVSGASTAGVTGVLLDFGITDMITGAMYAYSTDVSIVLERSTTDQGSSKTGVATNKTTEQRLKELKKLKDDGLISDEAFLSQQKIILNSM